VANIESRAYVVWEGGLMDGNGALTVENSGLLSDVPGVFASHTHSPQGKTTPTELIASEHATCYAMALSNVLSQQHTPPRRLTVDAVWTLDDEALEVRSVDLNVWGEVSSIDEEAFEDATRLADQLCPVSSALMGNVGIQLRAKLSK
jgi:lipoyl-dependent peroxiredoxin